MKLLKDSLIYLLGELAAKALPFLLLPYLTRKFGAAGYGDLSYWQTLLSLLVIVFSLSQDGALTRYFYVYGKRNLPGVMLAGYGYTALVTLAALGVAAAAQSINLAAVTCAAAAQSVLGVQLAYRQCQKRALSYTLIQTASGVLTSRQRRRFARRLRADAAQPPPHPPAPPVSGCPIHLRLWPAACAAPRQRLY